MKRMRINARNNSGSHMRRLATLEANFLKLSFPLSAACNPVPTSAALCDFYFGENQGPARDDGRSMESGLFCSRGNRIPLRAPTVRGMGHGRRH